MYQFIKFTTYLYIALDTSWILTASVWLFLIEKGEVYSLGNKFTKDHMYDSRQICFEHLKTIRRHDRLLELTWELILGTESSKSCFSLTPWACLGLVYIFSEAIQGRGPTLLWSLRDAHSPVPLCLSRDCRWVFITCLCAPPSAVDFAPFFLSWTVSRYWRLENYLSLIEEFSL